MDNQLRSYQREAFARFSIYTNDFPRKTYPLHFLFNMATGNGKIRLFPGAAFSGPAIVEERESTVIVGEDAKITVDEYGFLWIEMQRA